MVNYGLENRVALITGANNPQGIGAATAVAFAREGAKVVLVYKKIIRPFDESKTDRNGADRYFAANAGSADIVESRLREMNADYLADKPHTLVEDLAVVYAVDLGGGEGGRMSAPITNNLMEQYGVTTEELHDIALQNLSESQIEFKTMRDVLVDMMFPDHGDYGRIINFSTDASQVFAGQIAYGASKATLEALTRSIALEVAQYGITVNCVAPGPTQTGWIDDELEKAVIPLIPMGKLIQPEDIAETILFLASEQAGMLTGQVIKVSGGHAL